MGLGQAGAGQGPGTFNERRGGMWIASTIGFFSVVEKPWDREQGTLTVRARVRSDLEALRELYLPLLGGIVEDGAADYRFRAQAPREAVAVAMAALVRGIDYDNFKAAVGRRQGAARAAAYHEAWRAFSRLQEVEGAG